MNSIFGLAQKAEKLVRSNSPVILTALGVSGTVTTAYLAAKAGYHHARRMSDGPPTEDLTTREIVLEVWDLYIPPVISGVMAVGCTIAAVRVSSKRAAAAYSLVAVSEKALSEYRDKVVETIGANKEQRVRDEIAQDRVRDNPPGAVVIGSGSVLCCELFTGRYFMSDMETLRKAQNNINARLISQDYATLNDLYFEIGLPYTTDSGRLGWNVDKQLDMFFSAVMSETQVPCLAFEYNYVKPI